MSIAIVMIRIMGPIFLIIFLLWMIFDARESRFLPVRKTRIQIGIVGFTTGYVVLWALLGDGFTEHIWGKVLVGLLAAGQFAIRLINTMEAGMRRSRTEDAEDSPV